jgi:hypothetical protein
LQLDHVVIAVADLATAAREIEARQGLTSLEGGRHPGWGTANRIVPLGDTYLELVAVVDENEAARSRFGSWVAAAQPALVRPLGWAVRTEELDVVAARLGLDVAAGSRMTGDGTLLRWRLAGVEQAAAEPSLPFFIEWHAGTLFPGQAPVTHRAGDAQITGLRLDGEPGRLTDWLGPGSARLPITVRPAMPALTAVVVGAASGEIVLGTAEPEPPPAR